MDNARPNRSTDEILELLIDAVGANTYRFEFDDGRCVDRDDPQILDIVREHLVIVDANEAFARLAGYESRDEVLSSGLRYAGLFPDQGAFAQAFTQILSAGVRPVDDVRPRKGDDGQVRYVRQINRSLFREDQFCGLFGIQWDVTEDYAARHTVQLQNRQLNCTQSIGRLVELDLPIADFLGRVADLIPGSMQFSEVAVAAIEFEGHLYGQKETLDSAWRIAYGIVVNSQEIGRVHIAYIEQRSFLASESTHIRTVAERVGGYISRKRLLGEIERRSRQLQTAAQVARAASSILDPEVLIRQSVELIRGRFDYYYVGLFLVDESGQWAVLRSGTGEPGRQMVKRGHKLEIGGASMIGQCVARGEARITLDVDALSASGLAAESPRRFDNPLLPETRSEIALPLTSRGRQIGALTIQSTQEEAFSEEDIAALQTMADQLAVAIQTATLFEQVQVQAEQERLVRSITDQIHRATDRQEIMRITLRELGQVLGASRSIVRLGPKERLLAGAPTNSKK
ncbi:MAG: GAF domain-containing protein [Anaerolineae bacterium]|nr:GAF domain-containing protein [Anaerolineae bacterium]